jgi:nucleotide-binding universal stress UspA family protein
MKMKIVVATDGNQAAVGALRLAAALAQRHRGNVEVVAVMERLPIYGIISAETIAYAQRQIEDAGQMSLREHVEAQLAALDSTFAAWPLTVALGSPAPTIVRLAHEKEATLLLLGMGRHALADRWFGTETALRVMRLANVPVIAVPASTQALPRTAVVAVDFSEFSRDAVETALQIVQPSGTLHLTHVFRKPSLETPWVGGQDWLAAERDQAHQQLESLAEALESRAELRVPTHHLEGDPAREVLRLAEKVGAELIAAGSHGAGFFSRIMMGSASTRLVRGASCSVLIAPPRTLATDMEAVLEEERQPMPAHLP